MNVHIREVSYSVPGSLADLSLRQVPLHKQHRSHIPDRQMSGNNPSVKLSALCMTVPCIDTYYTFLMQPCFILLKKSSMPDVLYAYVSANLFPEARDFNLSPPPRWGKKGEMHPTLVGNFIILTEMRADRYVLSSVKRQFTLNLCSVNSIACQRH